MQRYRHSSLPSLLFKIMSSDGTCSASAVLPVCRAQGAGCLPPETTTGAFGRAEGGEGTFLHQTSLSKQQGWVKQRFIGAVFTLNIFRRHLQYRHSKLELPSLNFPTLWLWSQSPPSHWKLSLLKPCLPLSTQHGKSCHCAFCMPFVWISSCLL